LSRRPSVSSISELYAAEELSELKSLREMQNQLRQRREQTYKGALNQGLLPRGRDPTRFDERKAAARRINAKIDNLDQEFERLVVRVQALTSGVDGRFCEWRNEFRDWRFYSSSRVAFRAAAMSYLGFVATLLLLRPDWLQAFSAIVVNHMWLNLLPLVPAYGATVVGFCGAAAVGFLVGIINYKTIEESLADSREFQRIWTPDTEKELEEFRACCWIMDMEADDEDIEVVDGETKWDTDSNERPSIEDQNRPWFEVLEVTPKASLEEIKSAKRKLTWAYHSDRLKSVEGLHADISKFADGKMAEVNLAYEDALETCKSRSRDRVSPKSGKSDASPQRPANFGWDHERRDKASKLARRSKCFKFAHPAPRREMAPFLSVEARKNLGPNAVGFGGKFESRVRALFRQGRTDAVPSPRRWMSTE
jgi:hypothetical protein